MLGLSSHSFKVNFCKYTNETRLYLEDASRHSGLRFLAACKGTTAGGGYELALACDEIALVDDGNSAVSFPETPLLAVLPGTGGLTRLVDKRKVRRDRADVFCTVAEGIKGRRAVEWDLVDAIFPKSVFAEKVAARASEAAATSTRAAWPGIVLPAIEPVVEEGRLAFRHVVLDMDHDARVATLTLAGPGPDEPDAPAGILERGADAWALRAFRELDRALLHLRVDLPEIGLVLDPSIM
jgi:benzoyl-CoA-dihydrodiol lyase